MSFSLTSISGGLQALASWRMNLRPASFRGVPFYVEQAAGVGGRRKVEHQFALRDDPYIEDLGKAANRFRLTAWVVGDDYLSNSNALISALQDYDDAAVLVHPWRGEIQCQAGLISWRETKDLGGYCEFEIDFFVDPNAPASPTSLLDTVGQVLKGLASLAQLAIEAYETVSLIIAHPAMLLGFMGTLLGSVVSGLTGLPAGVITGLGSAIQAILLNPGSDSGTATAIQAVFTSCATNAVAWLTPPDLTGDPVLGESPTVGAVADMSAGLAALGAWGNTLPIPANPVQAQQQQILQSLVQGSAIAATIAVYAQIDWPNAQAATAARTQILGLIDTQLALTSALGQDDLYRGWQAVSGFAVLDLIRRAQALPSLVPFSLQASRPSLVLAWRWYQDAGRSDELESLNNAGDPMFMPYAGVRLSA